MAMNVLSENSMLEEMVSAEAMGSKRPESVGTWVLIWLSAALSGGTCW